MSQLTISNHQLTQVCGEDDADTDIVFIHGLLGNAYGTWTKNNVLWPQDLLPKDVPSCRVLLYGYDSRVLRTGRGQLPTSYTELRSDADDFCARLAADRASKSRTDKPIILIAHSLGGLVAAQAMVSGGAGVAGDVSQDVSRHVHGMIFFGTPFRGSNMARPFEAVRNILSSIGVQTQQHTLKLLGVDSDQVRALNEAFSKALRQRTETQFQTAVRAVFFHETLPTNGILVVPRESALMPNSGECLPIQANHHHICKFASAQDEGYKVVVNHIMRFINDANLFNSGAETHIYNNHGKAVNLLQGRSSQIINGGQTVTL